MKKIALHWQILAALIIAIIYGVVFNTDYVVNSSSISKLEESGLPTELVDKIKTLDGNSYKTKAAFREAISELGEVDYVEHGAIITQSLYYNPAVGYISWMGDLFIRALKMLIIPLVFASLISGVSNLGGGDNLGRLGLKTIGYYMLTSTLAITTGLFFVNIIKPGVGADTSFEQKVDGLATSAGTIGQTLMEIIPTNIFASMSEGKMLPIIFFAILLGFFINRIGDKPRMILTDFFNAFFDLMMKVTMWVIQFTPLGILGIVAKTVADQDDLVGLVSSMGLYMGTVLIALATHAFITLPLLTKFIGKANPLQHFRNVTTPLMTAFSTSSSGATLPLTMTAVEENDGVSNKITSFTLPLGATINMDGTALYELVAAMFIAQAYGFDMSITEQIIMVAAALLSSIGAAAIPMAGMVMLTIVLSAVGLPLEGIGLILAVDRILDMFRTSVNVWSDTCGAVIIAKTEGEELKV
ncbi:MAG: dicarboxylate/amino acid:cation symporter [Bacteroidetes bacterium 4572_112]|nr:MAG: dicarboxylate/amino acid:cation symporter [Bacteroidetes bacterium 4572_112]